MVVSIVNELFLFFNYFYFKYILCIVLLPNQHEQQFLWANYIITHAVQLSEAESNVVNISNRAALNTQVHVSVFQFR